MKYFFSSFFLLFGIQLSVAQYTEVINSRRPGFSDSPYSIGTKVYQVEGGLFYKNVGNYLYWDTDINGAVQYSATGFGTDMMLRTGQFFERLEFNLDIALHTESRSYSMGDTDLPDSGFGFSKLTLGAKYLVYKPEYTDKSKEIHSWEARHSFDKKRLIPAVGVYAGLNTNLLNELYKNPDGISPRLAIFTQNDLSNRLVLLTNFIMDKAFTDQSENSYIITVTYSLTEKWSVFGENQGFLRKNVPNDFQFGAGGAYLVHNNMQADFSARMIYDERGDNTYLIGGGVSWRLDKHKDKILGGKSDNDEAGSGEKRGFFNTITFGLFAGNKSHNTRRRDVKTSKAKTRSLTPPVNKRAQKAKKKNNKRLIKEQKHKEKAQKKYNKKSEKG